MLLSFHEWYRYEDILKMCTLTVISREKDDLEELAQNAEMLTARYNAKVIILKNHRPVILSSSDVRKAIRESAVSGMLSDKVWEYIRENGLYI